MTKDKNRIFFSYAREDAEFALKLAKDLRENGLNIWLDTLDIPAGERWDRSVEQALESSPAMLVILSPHSVNSSNVMDEVSYALEENKTTIPVLYKECKIPFRLRRLQYIDFTSDYDQAIKRFVSDLETSLGQSNNQPKPISKPVPAPIQKTNRTTGVILGCIIGLIYGLLWSLTIFSGKLWANIWNVILIFIIISGIIGAIVGFITGNNLKALIPIGIAFISMVIVLFLTEATFRSEVTEISVLVIGGGVLYIVTALIWTWIRKKKAQ